MKGTTALILLAQLMCALAPRHVAGKEQVQAVFAFTGVCFPVKENLVTYFINAVVNPITNSPWGTATQSGGYETLCARLPDGCTDIPGLGTGRAPAPAAAPAPALSLADSPAPAPAPADWPIDYSSNRGARAMLLAHSNSKEMKLSRGGSASSGSGGLLEEDGALADLISGSIPSPKSSGGGAHALGNRRLLWLEAPGDGEGKGKGRRLLQDADCSGKRWYLYLDTTDPADPEAIVQMIKDAINTGDFISRMDAIPGLRPESVIVKDIKIVDLPDDPPPPPPTDDGTAPNPDIGSPPADYAPPDYEANDLWEPPPAQQVEVVRAVFVFRGPCFPVSDSQVTEIILEVNALTGMPWGAPEQSGGFNSLCKMLDNMRKPLAGCPTDSGDGGSGTGRSGRRLQEGTCKNDKWYLYLHTANEPGSSDTIIQKLKNSLADGELMARLATTSLQVESVDYKVLAW